MRWQTYWDCVCSWIGARPNVIAHVLTFPALIFSPLLYLFLLFVFTFFYRLTWTSLLSIIIPCHHFSLCVLDFALFTSWFWTWSLFPSLFVVMMVFHSWCMIPLWGEPLISLRFSQIAHTSMPPCSPGLSYSSWTLVTGSYWWEHKHTLLLFQDAAWFTQTMQQCFSEIHTRGWMTGIIT